MENLSNKKCVPCQGGVPSLVEEKINELLVQLKEGWEVLHNPDRIKKLFKFDSFKEAIEFVNKVAELAEQEGHHPDFEIHYNKVEIILWTHKIDGLHENDFIMASKIDNL